MSQLKFKVSAALKNIIGKDLINDRYIAIFELVKNSYDAGANNVTIEFKDIDTPNAKIIIIDDGCGMSLNDIQNKWLFVAYSEKKHLHDREDDYRNKIKRKAAGAKGVGRFSCDRLGARLLLKSKTEEEELINELYVDWNRFEKDDTNEFVEIAVDFEKLNNLDNSLKKGTILEISDLRESWSRVELLMLKKSLLKLVNPEFTYEGFNFNEDIFNIYMKCDSEIEKDNEENSERDKINGIIINDIFEKLNIKTISLDVEISNDGKIITTSLHDRGEFIFKVKQVNEYDLLKSIRFKLFYMNRAAKINFTKIMGVEPVKYGSIFVYKNGFRIYPYGEEGQDFFDIDKRKTQGYNRFLGTRELMGRIQILGENDELYETTSRDGGFVKTDSLIQLENCFYKNVLKVLEKYVVDIVAWAEINEKKEIFTPIQPKDVIEKIVNQFVNFEKQSEILDIEYSSDILSYFDKQQQEGIAASIEKIEKLANKNNNEALQNIARDIKNQTSKLMLQKKEADKEIDKLTKNIEKVKSENVLREQQNYFLQNVANKDVNYLMNGVHLIFTHSETLKKNIKYLTEFLMENLSTIPDDIKDVIADINSDNLKINKLSEYSIKGNFDLKTDNKKNNLLDFTNQYISIVGNKKLEIEIISDNTKDYMCHFDAASIGIIIDNIISNSIKAKASRLDIYFLKEEKDVLIKFIDNGIGIVDNIDNIEMLFDLGITTTKGFGIGLYHVRILVEEMGGEVFINEDYINGFELDVRINI